MERFDTFEVAAVFENGEAIANDKVQSNSAEAIKAEIEETAAWWSDAEVKYFEIDFYQNGERVGDIRVTTAAEYDEEEINWF